jgi:queuine tRNA-ribosyltransferase
VGEPKPQMYEMLEALEPELPPPLPRYLMGVGYPDDLLEAIARGVDMFDCVAPTRNGRNGAVWITGRGRSTSSTSASATDPGRWIRTATATPAAPTRAPTCATCSWRGSG